MKKVLVVDDEEDLRGILTDILRIEGFFPLEAADGLNAITMVKKELPDAVILDLHMPGMDGLETLKELKKIASTLPVVVLTAFGNIPVAVKAMKLGAFNFFEKPPIFENIISIIKEATSISSRKILTDREMEVLGWVKEGKSNPEIAMITYLSENTVRTHLKKVFAKLEVQNRAQALLVAIQKGIFEL